MENKISAIIIVHNEDKIIREALESLKNCVEEIIVIHDGPCKDKTLEISEEYTQKVYTTEHKGRSAFNFIEGLKRTKYDWILKIDADESLSIKLQKDIKKLLKRNADGFSFIHPLWNGKRAFTKKWPRKTSLVRKSKISYLAFPGNDMSIPIKGKIEKTDYILIHKPINNQDVGWKGFRKKVLKKYAPSQAKYLLKNFDFFEKYNYSRKNFPLKIKIRRVFPILTNFCYGILVFFKQLFYEGAIKEGMAGVKIAIKTFIYNFYLGFLIKREKLKKLFS